MPSPRKRLPKLVRLDGNPGKGKIVDSGIEAYGEPFVPEHLEGDARGCMEVIKASMPPGIYSLLDTFHLSAFAMAWAIHKRAVQEINDPKFKYTITGSAGNKVVNPWLRILGDQAMKMVSLGDRLGLDPKARAALHLPHATQQRGELEEMLDARKTSSGSYSCSQSRAA